MSDKNIVLMRDADTGNNIRVDLSSGHVMDEVGNPIGRWEFRDDDDDHPSDVLADYCATYQRAMQMRALGSGLVARKGEFVTLREQGHFREEAVLMDLGPSDVHIPSAMPNYAAGYRLGIPIADIVAPPVLVNKQSDKFFTWSEDDAFQEVEPTIGAPGAAVREIHARLSNDTYSTISRALGSFVPLENEANADAPLRIYQAHLRRVMNGLAISRERRVATLVQATGSWNAALRVTLGAGFQWNEGASSDPILDLQRRIEASYMDVTALVLSELVLHDMQRNPAVQKYFYGKGGTPQLPTAGQLSALFDLPPIYVGRMKVKNPTTGALEYVWGNDVVLLHQPEENPPTTQDDVATCYTFRWNASRTADGFMSGGFLVRQFYDQKRGTRGGNVVIVVHDDDEQMTSSLVGGLIKSAHQ